MTAPSKEEIKEARQAAGLTQTEAAAVVYVELRAWQHWEAGTRPMQLGLWELFQCKTKRKRRK